MCVCSGKPQYNHVGEIVDGVDMRAEVALLSRNILVYGEMENQCYGRMCQFFSHDTYGGHIKVPLFTSVSAAVTVSAFVCVTLSRPLASSIHALHIHMLA